MSIYWN